MEEINNIRQDINDISKYCEEMQKSGCEMGAFAVKLTSIKAELARLEDKIEKGGE